MQSTAADDMAGLPAIAAHRFIRAFAGFVLAGALAAALLLVLLDRLHALPPPPVTGTSCIDEKLAFLRSADLGGVDFLAVGSSTTWRNLDLSVIERAGLARKPVNAAPCYLYTTQTAYWAEELLRLMPGVETVMTVISPRDFELCAPHETAFVSRHDLESYVFERGHGWLYYVTNLRPRDFVLDALRFRGWRTDPWTRSPMAMDVYGSSPVNTATGWQPGLTIDERCFAGLAKLEDVVVGAGARLLVVTLPTMPEWQRLYDPSGEVMRAFRERVRAELDAATTLLVDGSEYTVADAQFADPVHLLGSETTAFTNYVAAQALAAPHQHPTAR